MAVVLSMMVLGERRSKPGQILSMKPARAGQHQLAGLNSQAGLRKGGHKPIVLQIPVMMQRRRCTAVHPLATLRAAA